MKKFIPALLVPALIAGTVVMAGDPPSVIVINPGSTRAAEFMRGWRHSFDRRHLQEWGRSRGLDVLDDIGPVVDGRAAYVGPGGSSIVVRGGSRGARYRLWIDFVRYRDASHCPPALLRITASAPGGGVIRLSDLLPGDVGEEYYSIDLPPEATVTGVVEITFTELAPRPGLWGVWDMIIAPGDRLPEGASVREDEVIDLEIKERIVE